MDDLFGNAQPLREGASTMPDASRASNPMMRRPAEGHQNPHMVQKPLAERVRPQEFNDYLGQRGLIGESAPLRRLIEGNRIPSMILWGPPGSGKTTLARLISTHAEADFVSLSAVTSSIADVRGVVDTAKSNLKYGRRTILFIDEIHRFNKAQQDAFLPHVESGAITLIGATTENPSFAVIAPLLSRCRVFVLKALAEDEVVAVLLRGLGLLNRERQPDEVEISATEDALRMIARTSDGDARRGLGLLELAASVKWADGDAGTLTPEQIAEISQRHLVYDKTGEEHYNLISALHKTLRSSDPHGAAYWTGRILASGENPLFVARRLVRFASEDIGLADPQALVQAMEAMRAYQMLGPPEGDLALIQSAVYLAMAPKSNALYKAYGAIRAEIEKSGSLPVPLHLRNAPTKLMKDTGYGEGYTYDHDAAGNFAPKQGLPDPIAGQKYYAPSEHGFEKALKEHLDRLDEAREKARKGK